MTSPLRISLAFIVLVWAFALNAFEQQPSSEPAPDARQIVLQSVSHDDENFKIAGNYTYQKRVERNIDNKHEVMTYDLLPIYGEVYTKLIARDDRPLPEKEAQKENEKIDKYADKLRDESDREHKKRLEKQQEERQRGREFVEEIPDAYNFNMVGEDLVNGRNVWVIDCTPRPGFKPRTKLGHVLPKVKGRVYIDKQEHVWVKVEAEFIDDMSIGAFLIKLKKGAVVAFQAKKVNDEVWMPVEYNVAASARVLWAHKELQEKGTFSNYRKFTAQTRIIGDPQEVSPPDAVR